MPILCRCVLIPSPLLCTSSRGSTAFLTLVIFAAFLFSSCTRSVPSPLLCASWVCLWSCAGSKVKGSGIGGIEATQAVIDLCAQHRIYPEIKVIPVEGINHVYELLDAANDSGERYARRT